MSSIAFPHSEDGDLIPSSSMRDSMHVQFYTPPAFDTDNSFQMNPLSAHPPRTPRPSTAAQSHFGNNTATSYDEKSEGTEKGADEDTPEEEEEDEESERVVEAEKKVGRHEVWRDMLATSGGRDKAFVRMSYLSAHAVALTLLAAETDAIFDTCIPTVAYQSSLSKWQGCLAARTSEKVRVCPQRFLFYKVPCLEKMCVWVV